MIIKNTIKEAVFDAVKMSQNSDSSKKSILEKVVKNNPNTLTALTETALHSLARPMRGHFVWLHSQIGWLRGHR